MNEQFRSYAFARAFHIQLSERHTSALAALCRGDTIASLGLDPSIGGLMRRGMVERGWDEKAAAMFVRPTKVGLLVYQLLVEAGEHAALDALRLETLRLEHELQQQEWDERFAKVTIKLKDRHLRAPIPDEAPR